MKSTAKPKGISGKINQSPESRKKLAMGGAPGETGIISGKAIKKAACPEDSCPSLFRPYGSLC
jgi:hypothetical protein